MTFNVTYRSADGSLRNETVEAATRAECVTACRKRGITPVGIKEGKAQKAARAASAPSGGEAKRPWLIVALVLVVAIAGGVWLWLSPREQERPAKEKPAKTKVEKPQKPERKPTEKPVVTNTPAPPKVEKPKAPERPANWKDMTKEERAAWNEEHPRPPEPANVTMESISSLRPKVERKPIFHHSVHLELSHYAIPGRDMPPPDRISDKEALAAAEVPIEYLDDDTPQLRAKKEAVEMMLQEMKEYIQNGGHAKDYMQKLAERQQLEGEAVETTRREVRALMKEGKIDDAKAALQTYNAYLQTKGIPPIKIKGLK